MNKRISILFTFVCAFIFNAGAQDTIKTLFHPKKITALGFYVSPEYQFGQVAGSNVSLGANAIMVQFNNRFAIGVSMSRLLQSNFSPKLVTPLYLQANYNGLKLEYTLMPKSAVHFNISLVTGSANARADSTSYSFGNRGRQIINDTGNFFFGFRDPGLKSQYAFFQPGLNIELNLLRWVKLYAGASYRFGIPMGTNNQIAKTAMDGFSVNAGLKVGIFNVPPAQCKPRPWRHKRSKEQKS